MNSDTVYQTISLHFCTIGTAGYRRGWL